MDNRHRDGLKMQAMAVREKEKERRSTRCEAQITEETQIGHTRAFEASMEIRALGGRKSAPMAIDLQKTIDINNNGETNLDGSRSVHGRHRDGRKMQAMSVREKEKERWSTRRDLQKI